MPDRWRIWNTWKSLDLSSYAQYFRNQLWVHAICSQMHCLPARLNVFSQHSASSVQLRSRSRSPQPKRRPLSSVPRRSRSRSPQPKRLPGPSGLMPRGSIIFDLEDKTAKAAERECREESPLPDQKKAMWACVACGIMNTVHHLHCQVSRYGEGRPLLQQFDLRAGDWLCVECNNHNKGWRTLCNWTACQTRNWICPWEGCGNLNRSNRKFCNTRWCRYPRPFDFD